VQVDADPKARFAALQMQCKVQNTPRREIQHILIQATQEVANDMDGICHVNTLYARHVNTLYALHALRAFHKTLRCVHYVRYMHCIG